MRNSRNVLISAAVGAMACGVAGPALADTAPTAAADTSAGQQDIVVTATKRKETLMQVAAPISAFSGDQLAAMNANSLQDYITRMPGVVFNNYQPGVSEVIVRGISATTYHEQGQTTTGYYLNEIDLVEPNFPIGIPDIDTFDLDHVEVERGPQGTLFGSSALGGLVNYVAKTANVHKVEAAAEGEVGSTYHDDGQANYAGKAMLNIPIIKDKLAVRIMGLQRYDAGFIDYGTGLSAGTFVPIRKASNNFRTRALRGSIVFEPTDGTKITYMGAYQDTRLDDGTYVTFLNSYDRTPGALEPQRTSFFLNSLRLDQEIGKAATLTVIGSVDEKTNFTQFADPYGYITGATTPPNAAYDYTNAHANIKTVEARLASKDNGGPLKWLIGTSYIRSTKYSFDQMFAPGAEAYVEANPGGFAYPADVEAPNDRIYAYLSNTLNTDFGIFGDVTYRIVPGVEVTAGGRYYHTRAEGDVTNYAGYVSGSPVNLSGHTDQKDSGFLPKAEITLRPNAHYMAYFLYSQGYRVGGINPNAGLLPSLPLSYGSDKVHNYEAGLKTTLFDSRLAASVAVFDMDWKNIQAREFGPGPQYYSYVVNAASANVTGVEIALSIKPMRDLTLSTSITYEDAHLTSFLPYAFTAGGGYVAGSTLPGSSKWKVASNIDYVVTESALKPTISLAHRYLSSAPVAFADPGTAIFQRGNFNIFDARVGVTLPHNLKLMAFVDNMFNKYGILNGPFASSSFPAYSIERPRTYGLRVDWSL